MKPKVLATIAIAVVAIMVFGAVGSTTYSWFSDSDDTDINLKTAKFDITQSVTPTSDDCRIENDYIIKDTGFAPGDILNVNYSARYYSDIPTVYRAYAEYTGDDSLVDFITVNGERFISKKAVIIEWTFLESTGGVETDISDLPIDGISVEFSKEYDGSMHEALDCSVRIVTEIYQEAYYYNSVNSDVVARVGGAYYTSVSSAIDAATAENNIVYVLKDSVSDINSTGTYKSIGKNVTIRSVDTSPKAIKIVNAGNNTGVISINADVKFEDIIIDISYKNGNGWNQRGIFVNSGSLTLDGCKLIGSDLAIGIHVANSSKFYCYDTEFGTVEKVVGEKEPGVTAVYLRSSGECIIDGCYFKGFSNSISMEPVSAYQYTIISVTNNLFELDARLTSFNRGGINEPSDHNGKCNAFAVYWNYPPFTDNSTGAVLYEKGKPTFGKLTVSGNVFTVSDADKGALFSMTTYSEYGVPEGKEYILKDFLNYLIENNTCSDKLVYTYHNGGAWIEKPIVSEVVSE